MRPTLSHSATHSLKNPAIDFIQSRAVSDSLLLLNVLGNSTDSSIGNIVNNIVGYCILC